MEKKKLGVKFRNAFLSPYEKGRQKDDSLAQGKRGVRKFDS